MKPPREMTAGELAVVLAVGPAGQQPDGDGPVANGCLCYTDGKSLLDLIRRRHLIVMHRDYVRRIVGLLELQALQSQ